MKPLFPEVIVNGQTIAAGAIAAEAQHHRVPAGKPRLAWHAAAKAMVVRTLLLEEAQRLGVESDPQAVGDNIWETGEEASIRALLEQEIEPMAANLFVLYFGMQLVSSHRDVHGHD